MANGKDSFYRTLNLDKKTMSIISGFNKWKQKALSNNLEEGESVYNQSKKRKKVRRKPRSSESNDGQLLEQDSEGTDQECVDPNK
jgi:hypothetical protein